MKTRSCLDCPAYKSGACQIDGLHHLDIESAEAIDCPWERPIGKMPLMEVLATLDACCKSPKPACLHCPFKDTHFCTYLLASPASIQMCVQLVIKEFTSSDDELPF